MTLRHFQIFAAVVEWGTMNLAAEKLYISQPAISQAIRELEKGYGVKLFERFKKRLILTPEGELLLEGCRPLLAGYEQLGQIMHRAAGRPAIRIGATVSVGEELLVPLVTAFEAAYPEIRVEAVVNNTQSIEAGIMEGRLELGLIEGRVLEPELKLEPFVKDWMYLVAAPSHPLAERKEIWPKELAGCDMISREAGSLNRNILADLLEKHNVSPRVKWSCTNVHTIKQAVMAGQGIAMLSALVVREELQAGSLVRLRVKGISGERNISLVSHPKRQKNRLAECFMQFCREESRRIQAGHFAVGRQPESGEHGERQIGDRTDNAGTENDLDGTQLKLPQQKQAEEKQRNFNGL